MAPDRTRGKFFECPDDRGPHPVTNPFVRDSIRAQALKHMLRHDNSKIVHDDLFAFHVGATADLFPQPILQRNASLSKSPRLHLRMSGSDRLNNVGALPQNPPPNEYVPPISTPASNCPIVPPSEYVPPVLNIAPPPSIEFHVRSYVPPDCAETFTTFWLDPSPATSNNASATQPIERTAGH
jgi:hypothetical protein